jgi:hypothetical protein
MERVALLFHRTLGLLETSSQAFRWPVDSTVVAPGPGSVGMPDSPMAVHSSGSPLDDKFIGRRSPAVEHPGGQWVSPSELRSHKRARTRQRQLERAQDKKERKELEKREKLQGAADFCPSFSRCS